MAGFQATVAGKDLLSLNGLPVNDFAGGSYIDIKYPNARSDTQTGPNGNTTYARKQSCVNVTMTLRILRNHQTDKLLQTYISKEDNEYTSAGFITGIHTKLFGDEQGQPLNENWVLEGGRIMNQPNVMGDSEGNPDQATAEYEIFFAKGTRLQ